MRRTDANGNTTRYAYDAYGNRASMTYPDGKTVKYSYDELNRLVKLSGLGESVRYGYNAKGQRTETRTDKLTTKYAYDAAGNLVSQSTTGAYDLAFEYVYDKSGRITQESRTENGATLESSFVYDALGQLTEFTRSDDISESYTYDAVGNMLTKTASGVKTRYTYNAANQLVSDGENKYTYDKNGNLTQKGNVKYTYNALNLLESWTDGQTIESYSYNANGLLSRVTNDEGTTDLMWDVLMGDGVVISASTNGQETNYSYGLERISAQTGKTRTEYIYDGRGSVAAEVSYNSAWYTLGGAFSEKDVVSKSYTPFGEQIGEAVSGFGYNGEYYNAVTGMVYLRARFYEPEMNRFAQKDIVEGSITNGLSLNRYLYCKNDPVNFADINGKEAIVISGGDYKDNGGVNSENVNSYNFITTALREIELAKANHIDDNITWIIADEGWSESDKQSFTEAVDGLNVSIQYINNANQLTSYINTGNISSDNWSDVTQERLDDKITYMSIFSHGLAEGDISLAYNYKVNYNDSFDIGEETVNQWNSKAFTTESPTVEGSAIKIFTCRAFKGEEDSIGAKIAQQTGLDTYGYSGKSDYSYIALSVLKPNKFNLLKLYDYSKWKNNMQSKTFFYHLEQGTMIPSVYQPIASATNSTAYMATGDGTVFPVKEIPDLASNRTTAYVKRTPVKPSSFLNTRSADDMAAKIDAYARARSTTPPSTARTSLSNNSIFTVAKSVYNTVKSVCNTAKSIYNTAKNLASKVVNGLRGIAKK